MKLPGMLARGKAILGTLSNRGQGAMGAYMRDSGSPVMGSWRPALRDTQDDVSANWTLAAARAVETIQNSGWIAGGIRQAVLDTIGTGLRLAARPDTTVVKFAGLTDDDGNSIDAQG